MKKLLGVTVLTGALTVVKMAAGFVLSKVVAIYAGPGGLALLGQLQGLNSILTGIVNSPVGPGVVKYTAENCKEKNYEPCYPWWRAGAFLGLLLCFIITPTSILFSESISKNLLSSSEYNYLIITTAVFLPFSMMGTLFVSIVNGFRNYKLYISIGFISVIVTTTAMVVFTIKSNLNGALIAGAVQTGLIGIVSIVINLLQPWFKFKAFLGFFNKGHLKDMWGFMIMALASAFSLPAALIGIRIILVEFCGLQQTGEWQAVWKISEAYLAVITLALATYYLPTISALNDKSKIKAEINSCAKVLLPFVIVSCVVIFMLKDYIISILFTEEFSAARKLFAVQLIGDFLKVFAWLYSYVLLAKKLTKIFISIEIFFAVVFILVTYIFVSQVGVQGANYAYAFTYAFYLVMVKYCYHKYI
ncbi:O-antigen translocase [Enterobacter mori]|uniref:O-antigen translocase n=1 Tax=Enterobacter mori TaxID=539813 RepID=UPI00211361A8|nr:O-antigen translocase [Enterobacter mori]WKW36401.1 O-antigen translocase [Enterobacter mori]